MRFTVSLSVLAEVVGLIDKFGCLETREMAPVCLLSVHRCRIMPTDYLTLPL